VGVGDTDGHEAFRHRSRARLFDLPHNEDRANVVERPSEGLSLQEVLHAGAGTMKTRPGGSVVSIVL
jgi:hypothetical protein